MRRSMAITAGLAAGLGIGLFSAAAAWAQSAQPSPNVLVLGQPAGAPRAPTILRGSAVAPKVAPAKEVVSGQTQVVAGQQLWLIDPATGEVQSCLNLQTTQVGIRDIRCTIAELGDYSRTFGPNFHP
jgi:hypothetical protein